MAQRKKFYRWLRALHLDQLPTIVAHLSCSASQIYTLCSDQELLLKKQPKSTFKPKSTFMGCDIIVNNL